MAAIWYENPKSSRDDIRGEWEAIDIIKEITETYKINNENRIINHGGIEG